MIEFLLRIALAGFTMWLVRPMFCEQWATEVFMAISSYKGYDQYKDLEQVFSYRGRMSRQIPVGICLSTLICGLAIVAYAVYAPHFATGLLQWEALTLLLMAAYILVMDVIAALLIWYYFATTNPWIRKVEGLL